MITLSIFYFSLKKTKSFNNDIDNTNQFYTVTISSNKLIYKNKLG